jgi:hypothetical protein
MMTNSIIKTKITFFGEPRILACDANCKKAWGINNRPLIQLSDDEDDYVYLADDELDIAPEDPGTYEGGQAKPRALEDRLNKWCARECERSTIVEPGETIKLREFSRRVYNLPERERK